MLAGDGGDAVVVDLVDQAVAAQDVALAAHEGQQPRVDAHSGFDAEGAGDDVAARVVAGFVFGDVAGGQQFLHVTVVDGGAAEAALGQHVGAAVADVGECELGGGAVGGWHYGERGEGGAHPHLRAVAAGGLEDGGVGLHHGGLHHLGAWRTRGQAIAQHVGGHRAGHFTGLVATHPVGHREHERLGEVRVFIGFAHAAGIGGGAPAQHLAHWASNTVEPICSRSPLVMGRAPTSRPPFR